LQLHDSFTGNGCYLGLNVAKGALNKPVTQCSDSSQDGRTCQKLCVTLIGHMWKWLNWNHIYAEIWITHPHVIGSYCATLEVCGIAW